MDAAHLTPLLSHCFPQLGFGSLWKRSVTTQAKQEPLEDGGGRFGMRVISQLRVVGRSGLLSVAPLRGVHADTPFHEQAGYI